MSDPKAKKYMIIRWDEDQPDVVRAYTNERGWHLFFRQFTVRSKKPPRFFRDKIDGKRDIYLQVPLPAFQSRYGLRRIKKYHKPLTEEGKLALRLSMARARRAKKDYQHKPREASEDLITQVESLIRKKQEEPK